jgi:hypothetical protein
LTSTPSKLTLRQIFWLFRRQPGWLNYLWAHLPLKDLLQLEEWDDQEMGKAVRAQEVKHAAVSQRMCWALRDELRPKPVEPENAQRITDTDIERARHHSMPDLLNSKAGEKILCLYHDDSSPSMIIYKTHAHCYVCGAHKNPIDWTMDSEGISFAQAVRRLC